MTHFSANSERHSRLVVAAQILGVAVWIATILILIPTFLGFLVHESERGAPRLTAVFVCFPPPLN
jgi:hypothetical protein